MLNINFLISLIIHSGYYNFRMVIMLAYMIDWKYTVLYRKQLTNAKWFIDSSNKLQLNTSFLNENSDFVLNDLNINTSVVPEPLSNEAQKVFEEIMDLVQRNEEISLSDFVYNSLPFKTVDVNKYLNLELLI